MSVRSVLDGAAVARRWPALLCVLAFLAACQAPPDGAPPTTKPPVARTSENADAFEAWLAPRLGATQLLFEASQHGLDLMGDVMRARQPGSGVAPPRVAPFAARAAEAASASREKLAGQGPFTGGDDEQEMLARDADHHVVQMLASLQGFAGDLPRLDEVARALGPLRGADGVTLGHQIARLLAVQLRADSVFSDLVVGLLTPESAVLPERELQRVRRLGNETLLDSLRRFDDRGADGDAPPTSRVATDAAIARHRDGLAVANRKLERLRGAGDGLPADQRAPFAEMLRSYEEGLAAERDFLEALERFAPLVDAVDRDAPDAGPRMLAAFEGARWLTERVALRMRTNLARLRTLSDIGRGRRA